MPILFEWYKYVATLCATLACVSRHSPAVREISPVHFAVLTGLLNRCSRLMLSNMRLSVTNKYGETTSLLDRCIVESAIILQWLCNDHNDLRFRRYVADGVKKDLILKDQIQRSIAARGGPTLVIEKRMLSSIQKCIKSTGLAEHEIRETAPLPDLWSIFQDLGLSAKSYTAIQRMGSHEVHGTWTSLTHRYLRLDDHGEYHPRDHDVPPNENQFILIPTLILETLQVFLENIVPNPTDRDPIDATLAEDSGEMAQLTHEIVTPDFEFE